MHHFTLGSIPRSHGTGTGGVLSTAGKLRESFAQAFLGGDQSHGPKGKYFPTGQSRKKFQFWIKRIRTNWKMVIQMRNVGHIYSAHTKVMARQGLNPSGFSRGMGGPC